MHKQYLLALALTKGLGPVSVRNLIAYCGGVEEVFSASKGKLLKTPGIGEQFVKRLRARESLQRAEEELVFCEKHHISILSYLDSDYPDSLKFIHDAPLLLFKKGQAQLNAQPAIAMVGTRKATDYGKEMAEKLASFFARKGINVVSGLAYGIDIWSHKQVLKEGGVTTAVLAHGLDTIYPSIHAKKAREIQDKGALLTEYFTSTKPDAPHFPARNRIISGMCRAVIVVEAGESGGALITARYAFEQNREVYALPGRLGDAYSMGCNNLIRDNVAKLLTSPEEVLADLEIQWKTHEEHVQQLEMEFPQEDLHLSTDEMKVLNLLNKGDQLIDTLAGQSGIPMGRISSVLLGMEFKGIIRQMPGKRFKRLR